MKRGLHAHILVLTLFVVASCGTPGTVTPTLHSPSPTASHTPMAVPLPTRTPELANHSVAQLIVHVFDAASGRPVQDARVFVFQMLAYYAEERSTDATGQASFADLKSVGTTMITVEGDGYMTFRGKVDIIEGMNSVESSLTPLGAAISTPVRTSPLPSRWIDAHAHLSTDACHEGLCGADLMIRHMDESQIDKVVLFSIVDNPSEEVLDAWSRYPDRIVPLRGRDGLDLNDPSTLEVYRQDLQTGVFHGVGEIRTRHGWYGADDPPDHPVMLGLWQLAAEFGVPALVHMGTRPPGEDQTDIPQQWLDEFERALNQCPSTTFIWAHSGPARPGILRGMLDRHPNLYADLSALNPVFHELRGRDMPPELLIDGPEWIQLLEDYPDRFMFGTDNYLAEGYVGTARLVAYVRDEVFSQLSSDAVEAIAHGNAERLYGIPPSRE